MALHPDTQGREKAWSERLLVDDLAILIHRPPMGDVAGFRGDSHTAFGHGAFVGFVGNGIALGVNLSQGMIHRVVHLQFEHNITKFMLATGNKATFLFSSGGKYFFSSW